MHIHNFRFGKAAAVLAGVLLMAYVVNSFQPQLAPSASPPSRVHRVAFTKQQRILFVGRLSLSKSDDDDDDDDEDDDVAKQRSNLEGGVSGWKPPAEGEVPINPFENAASRPNKADLYSSDDLQDLLDLHTSIQDVVETTPNTDDTEGLVPPGLHEMVLDALASMDEEEENEDKSQNDDDNHDNQVNPQVLAKIVGIRAIASDVDGTLLCSDHSMHPTTERAVQDALQASFSPVQSLRYFFPATGKSRAGALASLGPKMGDLLKQMPGVFIQGLYVVDANGELIFQQKITTAEVSTAQSLAEEFDLSLFGYDGDSMYCTQSTCDDHREKFHSKFGEPLAQPMKDLTQYGPSFHKVLFMHDDDRFLTEVVRPKLEAMADEYQAEVTQAVPYMLELLPSGGGKANGVKKLCEHLGIDMGTQLLSMGDAENDIEMLSQSAIGVSMGNAGDATAKAADVNLKETNDMGGAGIAIQDYGLARLLRPRPLQ